MLQISEGLFALLCFILILYIVHVLICQQIHFERNIRRTDVIPECFSFLICYFCMNPIVGKNLNKFVLLTDVLDKINGDHSVRNYSSVL
jgi:hypothetical protein